VIYFGKIFFILLKNNNRNFVFNICFIVNSDFLMSDENTTIESNAYSSPSPSGSATLNRYSVDKSSFENWKESDEERIALEWLEKEVININNVSKSVVEMEKEMKDVLRNVIDERNQLKSELWEKELTIKRLDQILKVKVLFR
jgi:hypothetical protein